MLSALEKPVVLGIRDQMCGQLKSLLAHSRSQAGQKLPTARELAEHFKVSRATVQAALRDLEGEGLVSCEVGRGTYVRRTIEPFEAAHRGHTVIPTIGVICGVNDQHDLQHPRTDWTAGILFGMQQGLTEDGFALHIIPFDCRDEPASAGRARIEKRARALSGLALFPFTGADKFFDFAEEFGLPWVGINQYNHLVTHNFVSADYYGGGLAAGRLFAQLGLRRFVYLTSKGPSYSGLQKENGFRHGLSESGISPGTVHECVCDSYLTEYGYHAMTELLRQADAPPQGIFASGDLLALGAIKACQQRGLRVPEDVAVVGSTGIEASEHSTPTLSTVKLPMIEMGMHAARMLLSMIRRRERIMAGKILPIELTLRGSTPQVAVKANTN